MSLEPRNAVSLDHTKVFHEGCVKTRVNELTRLFMTKLEFEEKEKLREKEFAEAIKSKKPPKPFQWRALSQGERYDRYFEKAKKLAEEVREQERQNYVDARAEKDKRMIIEIARKLRFLVWTVDEESKPAKLQIIVERVTEPNYRGDYVTHDIQYVGDHDKERLRQIVTVRQRLEQLSPYVPYYSEEIKKLYNEALYLGTLDVIRKEKEKKEAKKS